MALEVGGWQFTVDSWKAQEMLPDLERLIQLQDIESRAAVASKAIADAPGRIAALDALLQSATTALAAAKQSLEDNKTSRRAIDKDLIADQQRLDKYKDQIMAVKTNEQLSRMIRPKAKGETFGETVQEQTELDATEVAENIRQGIGGPTWIRTRDQPVMSRWL